jgi:YD repeat-containing protein
MILPVDGSVTYAYQYDREAGTGIKTITDAAGTATEIYDKMDRLISRTDTWGKTITFAYTLAGRLKTIGYPLY